MNPWILSLWLFVAISDWMGGLGIATGVAVLYLIVSKKEQERFERKLWSWGWGFWD